MATLQELKARIAKGELKTRSGQIVRDLIPAYDLNHGKYYQVYVKGISWCLVSVYADTGMVNDDGREDEDDLLL